MKKFKYKCISQRGTEYFTEAENERKARASFQRKRNKYKDSIRSVALGTIECIGESEENKIIQSPLINILKTETQKIKEDYIQKTLDWAEVSYYNITSKAEWTTIDWCNWLNITPQIINEGTTSQRTAFPDNFWNSKLFRTYINMRNKVRPTKRMGLDAYKEKEQKHAEKHYESVIHKLAFRIADKGLDVHNIKVQSTRMGVNLDTVITDGKQTIHAWTIIAEGPVQRPHYRYLIKN